MARSSNKLLVPGIEQYLDQVKYEIAQEFGVHLGSDTVSRANGSVGGEITKRFVQQAQAHLSGYKSIIKTTYRNGKKSGYHIRTFLCVLS